MFSVFDYVHYCMQNAEENKLKLILLYNNVLTWGGGCTSICILGVCRARERPPFSALKFRSGAYHFHK